MKPFLLGCVPFAVGGLVATWVWRKALEAEQHGEPSLLRSLSGLILGTNVFATIALLLWERVWWPTLFAVPCALVAALMSLVLLVAAVVRQRDVDITALALVSVAGPLFAFLSDPPLA